MKPANWAAETWNCLVPVGSAVELENDLGELEKTKTRSEAWVLCNQPVVLVEGRSGGYLLYRLRPMAGKETAHALIMQVMDLHHQKCFNVLRMLVDTMRAAFARRTPGITPTLEIRPEILEQMDGLLQDVDPSNAGVRRGILDSLTAVPKVFIPFHGNPLSGR